MKIAVLNSGSTNNRKGAFNNVHERIKHLQEENDVEVDVFLLRYYDSWMFKLVRNRFRPQSTNSTFKESVTIIDSVRYNNLWIKHKVRGYILTIKLKLKDISGKSQIGKFVDCFKSYDLLSVHALPDMYLAYLVKQKYGIPFVTTWHGSDINVWPFVNKEGFKTTKLMLESADFNFFVSRRLLETSNKITTNNKKDVLYTGPADVYLEPYAESNMELSGRFNVSTRFLVGFIGNTVAIKNVMVLPDIFKKIQERVPDTGFVVVGNGDLLQQLKNKVAEYNIENLLFTGALTPEEVVDIMRRLNLLVLPSVNEGMPRVTLEAQASGVHVVGSDVGGIPESIGYENCFALDDDFVEKISARAIDILLSGKKAKPLSDKFSWQSAIEKEMRVYNDILTFRNYKGFE